MTVEATTVQVGGDSTTLEVAGEATTLVIPTDSIVLVSAIAGAGSGSAHTIRDEGVALPDRTSLDFRGQGVTATDTGGTSRVTIPGLDAYEAAGAVAAHVGAADPHPGYLTPAEGAAAFDPLGAAAAAQAASQPLDPDLTAIAGLVTQAFGRSLLTGADAAAILTILGRDDATLAEIIRDRIGATLVAGTNMTVTVDDLGDTVTLAAAGGGGVTDATAIAYAIALG